MGTEQVSYRPHDSGHNYYAPGIYLITLVVRNRRGQSTLFGTLNDDMKQPAVRLSALGEAILEEWNKIPTFEATKGRCVKVHSACCMPDHFHGVIEVTETMEVSVGQVIWGFKVACTKRWRELFSQPMTAEKAATETATEKAAAEMATEKAAAEMATEKGATERHTEKAATEMATEKAAAERHTEKGATEMATEKAAAERHTEKGATEMATEKAATEMATEKGATEQHTEKGAAERHTEKGATEMATEKAAAERHTEKGAAEQHTEKGAAERPSLVGQPDLHRMSKHQRALYYAQHPDVQQPLWDDNYDDTICLSDSATGNYSQQHFNNMLKYVADNARRAIIRRLRPQFMQRCLHVKIGGRDYAAFGNLFLLRWAKKVQVFCHRKAADGHTPYETTSAYSKDCEAWEAQILAGGTVIVTPGISRGEYLMKERCLECGYPLIHLQKEPIGAYWKPEEKRFNACSQGRLLILAPWKPAELGEVNGVPAVTDYAIFHNLNTLAEELCQFEGDAVVVGEGGL